MVEVVVKQEFRTEIHKILMHNLIHLQRCLSQIVKMMID